MHIQTHAHTDTRTNICTHTLVQINAREYMHPYLPVYRYVYIPFRSREIFFKIFLIYYL